MTDLEFEFRVEWDDPRGCAARSFHGAYPQSTFERRRALQLVHEDLAKFVDERVDEISTIAAGRADYRAHVTVIFADCHGAFALSSKIKVSDESDPLAIKQGLAELRTPIDRLVTSIFHAANSPGPRHSLYALLVEITKDIREFMGQKHVRPKTTWHMLVEERERERQVQETFLANNARLN